MNSRIDSIANDSEPVIRTPKDTQTTYGACNITVQLSKQTKLERLLFFSLITLNIAGCKSQNIDSVILQTSQNIVKAIRSGDESSFISIIGTEQSRAVKRTDEMLRFDLHRFKDSFDIYFKTEAPQIKLTNLYNQLGQRLITIPFPANTIRTHDFREMHLALLFGPPNFVALTTVSGYRLIKNSSDSAEFSKLSHWEK